MQKGRGYYRAALDPELASLTAEADAQGGRREVFDLSTRCQMAGDIALQRIAQRRA
jgi:hypothetical protein